MSRQIGFIHIDYTLERDGSIITGLDCEGDIPLVTQLGLLEMAKDTLLHPPTDPEDYNGH